MSGDRCSGACCREFALTGIGDTPEAIQAYLRRPNVQDGEQIADMLVPLRRIEVGTRAPNGQVVDEAPHGGGWIFTCRHFDPATSNCGIYASRPRMCRAFPYGKPCEHREACTWTAGRAGAWPATFERWGTYGGEFERHTHLRVLQPGGAPNQQAALRPVLQRTVDEPDPGSPVAA